MELQLECCLRLLIEILSAYTDALKKLGKQDRDQPLAIFQRVLAKQARLEEREGTSDDIMTHVASYLIGLVSIIKNPATALEHMKLLKNVHDVFGGHQCMKDAIGRKRVQLISELLRMNFLRHTNCTLTFEVL